MIIILDSNLAEVAVGEIDLTGISKPTGISFSQISYSAEPEQTISIVARKTPSNSYGTIVYESSDTDVAEVDASGTVTTKTKGSTTITARLGELTASALLEVKTSSVFEWSSGYHTGNTFQNLSQYMHTQFMDDTEFPDNQLVDINDTDYSLYMTRSTIDNTRDQFKQFYKYAIKEFGSKGSTVTAVKGKEALFELIIKKNDNTAITNFEEVASKLVIRPFDSISWQNRVYIKYATSNGAGVSPHSDATNGKLVQTYCGFGRTQIPSGTVLNASGQYCIYIVGFKDGKKVTDSKGYNKTLTINYATYDYFDLKVFKLVEGTTATSDTITPEECYDAVTAVFPTE